METTKNTQILNFKKDVNFNGNTIEMRITVEDGFNVKGNLLRQVNDDGSSLLYEAKKKFEDFEISIDEMVSAIVSKGYKLVK